MLKSNDFNFKLCNNPLQDFNEIFRRITLLNDLFKKRIKKFLAYRQL